MLRARGANGQFLFWARHPWELQARDISNSHRLRVPLFFRPFPLAEVYHLRQSFSALGLYLNHLGTWKRRRFQAHPTPPASLRVLTNPPSDSASQHSLNGADSEYWFSYFIRDQNNFKNWLKKNRFIFLVEKTSY